MGTAAVLPWIIAAASAGASVYNTRRTENKQDAIAASGIRQQARTQREADARVREEVENVKNSTAAEERAASLAAFSRQLRENKVASEGALNTPGYGGDLFQAGLKEAKGGLEKYGGEQANLMARMEAPTYQRQGERFSQGYLGNDIGIYKRESEGNNLINQLRINATRRNPWIDAAARLGMMYAGSAIGGQLFGGTPGTVPGAGGSAWTPGTFTKPPVGHPFGPPPIG